jgi:hypothetical protein
MKMRTCFDEEAALSRCFAQEEHPSPIHPLCSISGFQAETPLTTEITEMTKCLLAENCLPIPVKALGMKLHETLSFGRCPKLLVVYLPYFERIKADLHDHRAVCVSPLSTFDCLN